MTLSARDGTLQAFMQAESALRKQGLNAGSARDAAHAAVSAMTHLSFEDAAAAARSRQEQQTRDYWENRAFIERIRNKAI